MFAQRKPPMTWTKAEHQKQAQGYFADALQADALGDRKQADYLLENAIYHEREAQAA